MVMTGMLLNFLHLINAQNIQNGTCIFHYPRCYSHFVTWTGRHFFRAKESTVQLYQLSDFFVER